MEEYRFEKIVNAAYKEQFYNKIYNRDVLDSSIKVESKQEMMMDGSKIKNPKVFFATNYGSTYGKANYSEF